MIVTESVLERSLFHIFRNRDLHAGSRLLLTDLQYYWTSTGLRADDLRDAVRYLRSKHLLQLDGDSDEAAVRLTQAGQQRLRELNVVLPQNDEQIHNVLVLSEARNRLRRPQARAATERRGNE